MATDTQAIKDRLEIAQIIGEYVSLKKAGANWKGCCPFHHEKTPSFMVHPEKQIWHCFGCGKGGDIFTFIQEIEGLDFVESLKLMARRAGVEIDVNENNVDKNQRNRLLEINTAAATFFHKFLLEIPASQIARDYLEKRGLKNETIIDWQIGYISDQWDLLTKYLVKKGFAIDDLVLAGLTIRRDGADPVSGRGYYDRFRGRVMFPICDTHGNVIGFTGRVLVETENSGGKYVNTPETLLYEKSRVLYGIHKAKTEIKAKDLAVLVEGQMDVVACHQAGMKNVVAASGTALTNEQIKLLKRYSNNIAMAFDADAAGLKAGKRGIEVALEQGMSIKVIRIPAGAGKDADECLKKNPNVWFDSVKNSIGVMNWYFAVTLDGIDRGDYKAKQNAADILLQEISRIPNGVERDEWLKRLGDELAIENDVLREELKKIKARPAPRRNEQTEVKKAPSIVIPKSPYEILIEEYWSMLVKNADLYGDVREFLRPEFFAHTGFSALYELAEMLYNKHHQLNIDELRVLTLDGPVTIDLLFLRPTKDFENPGRAEICAELKEITHRIKDKWREMRCRQIQKEIGEAEKSKDSERIMRLMNELQSLNKN